MREMSDVWDQRLDLAFMVYSSRSRNDPSATTASSSTLPSPSPSPSASGSKRRKFFSPPAEVLNNPDHNDGELIAIIGVIKPGALRALM